MARGSGRDKRDTFDIDRIRFVNRASDPTVAPQKGTCEVYIKNRNIWSICENGFAKPITGVGFGASPGFSWGRKGSINAGTFLLNDEVPSNLTGRVVELNGPIIRKIYVTNSAIATFTVTIIEHEGTVGSRVSLLSVVVTAARKGTFDVSVPMTSGKQLAVQITGTANPKPTDIVVGVLLDGTL